MTEAPRTTDRTTAIASTVVFHALLLGIFFVSMVKLPDPPILGGGDGIVLNYGQPDEFGAGDVQTTAPANASTNREDSAPSQSDPTPPPPTESTPTPTQPDPEPEAKPTVTSEVEETVAAPKVEPKPDPKPTTREATKPTPEPVVNAASTYKPKNTGGNGTNGTANTPTGNNNGDRPGRVGDQGNPNGDLNAKALYGSPGPGKGGSGGGALDMQGWTWDEKPKVNDVSSENGILVFRIKVSPEGELESIVKLSGNVTPQVEQLYRSALEETSFRRTAAGAGGAQGVVTFRIVAR